MAIAGKFRRAKRKLGGWEENNKGVSGVRSFDIPSRGDFFSAFQSLKGPCPLAIAATI
jgi:hypothetical protein